MLLAEELTLIAISPDSGRYATGTRSQLNACLAGLLVAELLLDGVAANGEREGSVVLTGRPAPGSETLAAVVGVVADRGPKVKAILSHMDRGLHHALDAGTWERSVSGLVDAGLLSPPSGGILPRTELLDPAARDAVVTRLRTAAAGDEPLDPRTALLLSMAGPAHLLEVVAPDRRNRGHARRRIDHALDGTELAPIGQVVRRLIADAAAASAGGAAGVIASGS